MISGPQHDVKKGWQSLLEKRRWRLLVVVLGTIFLSTLHGLFEAYPDPVDFPAVLYFSFLLFCLYMPGIQYMIFPIAFALWWVVDLRRKFVPVAVYFAVLIFMTVTLIFIKYGNDIRETEREYYEAILDEQMMR